VSTSRTPCPEGKKEASTTFSFGREKKAIRGEKAGLVAVEKERRKAPRVQHLLARRTPP